MPFLFAHFSPSPPHHSSRRIELIQDLEFPAACHRLKLSPDGNFLFASGTHAPRVRVYELSQLALKFERHLDSEIIDYQVLDPDFSKAAFLCVDRSICVHARYGAHFKTRVPRFGRDIAFVPHSADLIVGGTGDELWRLNLAEGRFAAPLRTRADGTNVLALCPGHGLLAAGCDAGIVELFDTRAREAAGWLDGAAGAGCAGADVTALRADAGGLTLAVGTSAGIVALYDVRSSRPLLTKDLMYGSRVVDLKFHGGAADADDGSSAPAAASTALPRRVVSADRHAVKLWSASDGTPFTTITPPEGGVNDVLVWPGSGLIMVAADAPRVSAYFLPSLGPAPAWCSFLEGLTEELEEAAAPAVYDDYRFVTPKDVETLGLTPLLSTPALRPYMHGYFVHNALWHRAKAAAAPFEYEAWRRETVEARLAAAPSERIAPARRLPKVNAATAARLLTAKGKADGGDADAVNDANPLGDARFAAMFADPAFAVDEESAEFKAAHPNAASNARAKALLREHFDELEGGEEEEEGVPSASPAESGGDHDMPTAAPPAKRRMFAAKGAAAAAAYGASKSLAAARARPLADRAAEAAAAGRGGGAKWAAGSRELSFVPRGGGGGRGRGGRGTSGRGGGRGRGRGRGRG